MTNVKAARETRPARSTRAMEPVDSMILLRSTTKLATADVELHRVFRTSGVAAVDVPGLGPLTGSPPGGPAQPD